MGLVRLHSRRTKPALVFENEEGFNLVVRTHTNSVPARAALNNEVPVNRFLKREHLLAEFGHNRVVNFCEMIRILFHVAEQLQFRFIHGAALCFGRLIGSGARTVEKRMHVREGANIFSNA